MHAKAQHVQQVLDSYGVKTEVRQLPSSTHSAEDAASSIGTTVPRIAKSLVFSAGDELVLVIASGGNRVSVEKVGKAINAELTQPDGKTVKKRTGYSIGGVPPVGHPEPMRTLVDEDLTGYSLIWAAAGTPNAVFSITPDELVRVTGGEVVEIAE